jgi:hypothetical protein
MRSRAPEAFSNSITHSVVGPTNEPGGNSTNVAAADGSLRDTGRDGCWHRFLRE